MYKIVVPTDFSKLSEQALDVALEIARRTQGAVYLLNVIGDVKNYSFSSMGGGVSDQYVSEDDRYILELHRANERRLKQLIAKHQHGDVPVFPFIEIDDLDEGVNHFAERLHCDLVVMGTSGENTMTEYFEGNHAEKVIRITHIPVLTIQEKIEKFEVNNIVFATDLKTVAKEGVDQIEKFATFFGATVHMVHVSNDNPENVRKKMEAFAVEHETPHQVPELTINPLKGGKVEETILEFAKQKNAEVIASVNHGRKGLMHLFVGGMSERLVRDATVPVFTVHMDPH